MTKWYVTEHSVQAIVSICFVQSVVFDYAMLAFKENVKYSFCAISCENKSLHSFVVKSLECLNR